MFLGRPDWPDANATTTRFSGPHLQESNRVGDAGDRLPAIRTELAWLDHTFRIADNAETIALKVVSRPFTVVDDVRSDRSSRVKLGLCCGFASVLLFGFVYVITNWRGHPGQAPVSVYFTFVALPIVVVLSVACSLIGTFKHSKWWVVVAILSGLYACLWFGTSSV